MEEEPIHLQSILEEYPENNLLTKSDVLQWLTGSRYLMPKMIGAGQVIFVHDGSKGKRRMVSRTCALHLEIPVNVRYTESQDNFVKHICDDILSSQSFSLV